MNTIMNLYGVQAKRSVYWSQFMLAFHFTVAAYSLYTSQWILIPIISFHSFFANWLRFFMGMTQHCGLRDNVPDFRKSVRSITLDPLSEFLYWNMNWHTEHHMFANVPCYNLKALHHTVAADMPKPRTIFSAWREMLDTHERQKKDPTYQYDTLLPDTAGKVRSCLLGAACLAAHPGYPSFPFFSCMRDPRVERGPHFRERKGVVCVGGHTHLRAHMVASVVHPG